MPRARENGLGASAGGVPVATLPRRPEDPCRVSTKKCTRGAEPRRRTHPTKKCPGVDSTTTPPPSPDSSHPTLARCRSRRLLARSSPARAPESVSPPAASAGRRSLRARFWNPPPPPGEKARRILLRRIPAVLRRGRVRPRRTSPPRVAPELRSARRPRCRPPPASPTASPCARAIACPSRPRDVEDPKSSCASLVRRAIDEAGATSTARATTATSARSAPGSSRRSTPRVRALRPLGHEQAVEHVPPPRARPRRVRQDPRGPRRGLPRPLPDPLPHLPRVRPVRDALPPSGCTTRTPRTPPTAS